MATTIGENGQVLEWRERELNGGSTQRELFEDKRRNKPVIASPRPIAEKSFEDWLQETTDHAVTMDRARIAQAMKRCPLVTYDMRGALLKLIYDKGE